MKVNLQMGWRGFLTRFLAVLIPGICAVLWQSAGIYVLTIVVYLHVTLFYDLQPAR